MNDSSNPIKVAVIGALGKVGTVICDAVSVDTGLELSARIDSANDANYPEATGAAVHESLETALKNGVEMDVAVDFTVATSAEKNLKVLGENGIHAVVGTSGISEKTIQSLENIFKNSNCLIAPNFSISAALMLRFSEISAPFFDSAEIVEMHHEEKIDAPSGTALETLRRMENASDSWILDSTQKENLKNVRGGSGNSGIRIHSLRMKGAIAHQEVRLGGKGEMLTIRQDSMDRSSFVPGVLMAVRAIDGHPGITIGLDRLLGL